MGKKYVVIEVEETSGDTYTPEVLYPFFLIPPFLSIFSLVAFRAEGGFCSPRKAWILAIIDMIITFAVSIGLFFGVSHLSAIIPFIFFLWSCANLAHGIIGDYGNDFIEKTKIDIAIFFCILFLAVGGIAETSFALQPVDATAYRSIVNCIWLLCAVCILHFSAIFLFAYLNKIIVGENVRGMLHFGLTVLYLLPALVCIIFAVIYAVDPMSAILLLKPTGTGGLYVSFISVAFMIPEGILLIIGRGNGYARFGIVQGILNFVFIALSAASVALSVVFTPAELHIDSVSKWEAAAVYSVSGFGKEIHCYLECDLDFDEGQISMLSLKSGDSIDGQGNKLVNGISKANGTGIFGSNSGQIKNLTLERCLIFHVSDYYGAAVGAFSSRNWGMIENCHAIETYIIYSGEEDTKYTQKKEIYIGGIAGENYGTIKDCSFKNSDLNEAFPCSIMCPERAVFSEIAHNEGSGSIIDCYFFGTHGVGEANLGIK